MPACEINKHLGYDSQTGTVYLGTFETEEQAKEAYQKHKNQFLSECEVCQ